MRERERVAEVPVQVEHVGAEGRRQEEERRKPRRSTPPQEHHERRQQREPEQPRRDGEAAEEEVAERRRSGCPEQCERSADDVGEADRDELPHGRYVKLAACTPSSRVSPLWRLG